MKTACPASMCPLFAPNGSPWTGEYNAPCDMGPPCAFWQAGKCVGGDSSRFEVNEVIAGRLPLQLRPAPKLEAKAGEFDCPHAATCQWQAQSSPSLCPPRFALKNGVDPRVCGY